MKFLEIITHCGAPVAILAEQRLHSSQLDLAYRLLPNGSHFSLELSRRWGIAMVLCEPDWESDQKRRNPMRRPKGHRMAFMASPTERVEASIRELDLVTIRRALLAGRFDREAVSAFDRQFSRWSSAKRQSMKNRRSICH